MMKKLPKNQWKNVIIFQKYWYGVTNGIILVVVSRVSGNSLLSLSFNSISKLGRVPIFNEINDAMDVSIW